jgi:hypothetical protein
VHDAPLRGADIRRLLLEVAELLPPGARHSLVIAGGSLLALHELRDATRDVDSIRRLDREVLSAAAAVARRHDLPQSWLNDRAAPFWPQGLTVDVCTPLLEHERLLVLEPPFEFVFVMKLEASRAADKADMRALWPLCSFADAEEAAALWESAYPYRERDPYLAAFIRELVR